MPVVKHLVTSQHVHRNVARIYGSLAKVLALVGDFRQVGSGHYCEYSGKLQRVFHIYRFDPGVRMRTSQDLAVNHPRKRIVRAIFGAARNLVDSVVADGTGADYSKWGDFIALSFFHVTSPWPVRARWNGGKA